MLAAHWQNRSRSRLRGVPRLIVATSLVTSSFVVVTAANVAPSIAAPPVGMFTQISAGYSHTCAVDAQGAIWCWGSDSKGQLGNGATTTEDQQSPVKVTAPVGVEFVQVSAGKEFTCAVASNDKAYCWGDDSSEQLGDGSGATARNAPVEVQETRSVVRVDAADGHACAVVVDDSSPFFIDCWGSDGQGQLGDGATSGPQASPVTPRPNGDPYEDPIDALHLSASSQTSCAVKPWGTAMCWGAGTSGQIGNSGSSSQASPVAVTGLSGTRLFASITGGDAHTCATATDGTAWCWGSDADGQLGNAASGSSNAPSAVTMPLGKTFTEIAGGGAFTCALTADGLVYCWGSDAKGQIGNGSTIGTQVVPSAVTMPSGKRFTSVSAGAEHACAVSGDGLAYCWGSDANGKLGNGASISGDKTLPTAVAMPTTGAGWSSVSAGASHTCAIASDGTVWCWGSDANGQLGNGSVTGTKYAPDPVAASTSITFKQISAGSTHTCAISTLGTAYCWGSDSSGLLGNGSGSSFTQFAPSAVTMPSGKYFVQISAGRYHSCAIASDSTAWCWGSDASQQLGNGLTNSTQHQPVAVQLPTDKRFVSISVGDAFSCALSDDMLTYCWGSDASGQLGNGDDPAVTQPVPYRTLHSAGSVFSLSAGASHTCYASLGLGVSCSGSDESGQIGNGAPTGNVTGYSGTGTSDNYRISAGASHTCAILLDGNAACWGSDASGQLGSGGTASDQNSPAAVATSKGEPYIGIDAGASHTCATTAGGSLWCWGSDAAGQLGDAGTAADAFEPVEIDPAYSPVKLTVSIEGDGFVVSGETGATPLKIDCPDDCDEANIPYGTSVTLTATGDSSQWAFAGWAGGACSGTGSCTLIMRANATVIARFGVLLTLTKSTAAAGTVVSTTYKGFTCDASCASFQQRYAIGTTVRIKATPATGYTMRSWSGCSSSSITTSPPSCSVSMSASKSVGAVFGSAITVTKELNKASITSTPTGISCGTTCTTSAAVNFVAGSTLMLTATLSPGFTTVVWTNCTVDPVDSKKCTLIVAGAVTVNAAIS